MANKLPSNNKRVKAAARAIEYRAAGKSWREIDDMVKQEHPDCAATAVFDAMYRLDHLDAEDWLPKTPVTPEPVRRYQDALIDWRIEVRDPWLAQLEADAVAFRKQTGVRGRTPESRAWYMERRSSEPVFEPPDISMVKDYRDLP